MRISRNKCATICGIIAWTLALCATAEGVVAEFPGRNVVVRGIRGNIIVPTTPAAEADGDAEARRQRVYPSSCPNQSRVDKKMGDKKKGKTGSRSLFVFHLFVGTNHAN
jgi:hypothetical protein